MRVLYDAWEWAYRPAGPAALRLARLLERLPPEVEPVLAVPAPPAFAVSVVTVAAPTPDTPWGRLRWEQVHLPALARRVGAQVLHGFHGLPWRSPVPVVHEGALPPARGRLAQRLRAALTQAARATRPWPKPTLPPPYFAPQTQVPPPEGAPYVLAFGPYRAAEVQRLLQAWAWAAEAIGAQTPLALYGLPAGLMVPVRQMLAQVPWGETVRLLPPGPPQQALGLLHHAAALVQVGWPPFAEEVVGAALALGVPVVGEETPALGDLVGPAAYLTPPGEARLLAAALITVVVEAEVAAALRQAAFNRVAQADPRAWGAALLRWYRRAVADR